MATLELTKEVLDKTIADNDIVLIDFWASWCGPCRMFAPTFEAAAEKHSDIVFAKCDTEAQQELAASFAIRSIPTLAVFRGQIPVFMQPGALPASALDDLIEQIKGLDMDEVRQKIADHEAAEKKDA